MKPFNHLMFLLIILINGLIALEVDRSATQTGQPWVMSNGAVYRDTVTMQWSKDVAQFAAQHQRREDNQAVERVALRQRVGVSKPESPSKLPTFFSKTLHTPVGRRFNLRNLNYGISRRMRAPPRDHEQHRARADQEEARIIAQRKIDDRADNNINNRNVNINNRKNVRSEVNGNFVNIDRSRQLVEKNRSSNRVAVGQSTATALPRPTVRTLYKLHVAPSNPTLLPSTKLFGSSQRVRNAHLLSALDRNIDARLINNHFAFFG